MRVRAPVVLLPIACLALAGLVAAAVSRLRLPGAAAVVIVLLLVDLRLGMFHPTTADPHNHVYAALEQHSPGRLLELPVFEAGSQSASVYLYYLMQAPHEHPSGYSTTAPLAALHVKKEAVPPGGTLALEGTTHTYLTFFPDGVAAGRKFILVVDQVEQQLDVSDAVVLMRHDGTKQRAAFIIRGHGARLDLLPNLRRSDLKGSDRQLKPVLIGIALW